MWERKEEKWRTGEEEGGEWGEEREGRGRWGGRSEKRKEEILMFRGQENILNGGRVVI